jgi:hypothetical protein
MYEHVVALQQARVQGDLARGAQMSSERYPERVNVDDAISLVTLGDA